MKRDLAGKVDFVSPVPCPFNYGSVVGTLAEDGDPIDAVVLGGRIHRGEQRVCTAWSWAEFVDDGAADPKLICTVGTQPPTRADLLAVRGFFRLYARCKRWLNRLRGRRGSTRYRGLRS